MNGEGYPDPTAEKAISRVEHEKKHGTISGYLPPDAYTIAKPALLALSMLGFSVKITLRDADGDYYKLRFDK